MKVAEDGDVLKAVVFDNVRIWAQYELFQQINGLLNRCAQAGNVSAQYLLAKIILLSAPDLCTRGLKRGKSGGDHGLTDNACSSKITMEDSPTAYFMAHFMPPENACTGKASFQASLPHYELVKLFFRQCGPYDIGMMHLNLKSYLDYFIVPTSDGHWIIRDSIHEIRSSGGDCGSTSVKLEKIKDILNYYISNWRVVAMSARQSYDYPFYHIERFQALEDANLRFGATIVEQNVRTYVPGLNFKALFVENINLGVNMKYYRELHRVFEEYRRKVILAFTSIFPS